MSAPTKPFVVVGMVEVRTSRPKTSEELMAALSKEGEKLNADALIPAQKAARTGPYAASANPYRGYYVADDGMTQLLEAEAIRYRYEEPAEP